MEKRTILRAYRAAEALKQMPHGMKQGLQLVRLKKDLAEGQELDEAQRDAIESYGGLGAEIDDEQAEAFREEMEDLLGGEAETDAEDIRPIDLTGFSANGQSPDGQFGDWIEALIEVDCISYDQAMEMLEELEG